MLKTTATAATALLILFHSRPAWSVTCQGVQQPTTLETCQSGWLCTGDGWVERYYAAGSHSCNDGDACTTNDLCQGGNVCRGTLSCVPGVPGPMGGPSTNTTGSYTVTWGTASGVVAEYQLYENNIFYGTFAPPTASYALTRSAGSYAYKVRACNSAGCGGFNATLTVTVVFPPGMPSWPSGSAGETGPSYTISWNPGSGTIDRYDLGESQDQTSWATTSVTGTWQSFSGKGYGTYYYRVRACNAAGCSAYTATNARTVQVVTWLSTPTVPDMDPVPPSQPIPAQGWVGTLPGAPSVEGGAATYRVPIEIPPGRAGVQASISLAYSSRNGNGIAGVGWGISGTSSIYRCPRTLAQDGGNRPVIRDSSVPDALCYDGQRLITDGQQYGLMNTQYRTEIDQFARITLRYGDISLWTSMFIVEHKNGRISFFSPIYSGGQGGNPPDVWYLVGESDRQGNCTKYLYADYQNRTYAEPVLADVAYTGSMAPYTTPGWPEFQQCTIDANARHVSFEYENRPDNRTTYRYGVAVPMTVRLKAVTTKLGTQAVRRYELSYTQSDATGRSLLTSVQLCAGQTCGTETLPPTTFTYQQDRPTFGRNHETFNGQVLGTDWRVLPAADYDGDGTRDSFYVHLSAGNPDQYYLELSGCKQTPTLFTNTSWPIPFDDDLDTTPKAVERATADLNSDGRVDLIGTSNGHLAFASVWCSNSGGPVTWQATETDLSWSPSYNPDGTFPTPMAFDYDGNGIFDVYFRFYPSSPSERIYRHNVKTLTAWATTNSTAFYGPTPPAQTVNILRSDLNGDGRVDWVFDATNAAQTFTTYVVFNIGTNQYAQYELKDLGGPLDGSFSTHPERRWIDVNGDGLPDIYEAGQLWLNRGRSPGTAPAGSAKLFTGPISVARPQFAPNRLKYAFTMDVDADGKDELFVPDHRVWTTYCGGNASVTYPPDNAPAWFCWDDFDTAPPQWQAFDRSVFAWNAYKFVEATDGSYSLVQVPYGTLQPPAFGETVAALWAPINYDLATGDPNGDGMSDVYFRLINSINNNHYDLAASELGPWTARNSAKAPDLLIGVTNGVGASAAWQHNPLSLPSTQNVPGCDRTNGEPFYTVHLETGPADKKHSDGYLYFASSMWTVSRFEVDSGVGTSKNPTCYRYQDAMLNGEGRGFQGFKMITAEEQLLPAAGERSPTWSLHCGGVSGGTCSANNLRTTTEFFQEFPLTSKLSKVTVTTLDGLKLSEATYWWDTQYSSFTSAAPRVFEVFASGHEEKKYEFVPNSQPPTTTLATSAWTISEFAQSSGEPSLTCTGSSGQATDAARDVILRDTRTMDDDPQNWILGRLLSRELYSDFYSGGSPLEAPAPPHDNTCQLSGSPGIWSPCTLRSTPLCPALSATGTQKVRTTNYTWNSNSASTGNRLLQSETTIFQSTTESQTNYTYLDFANVGSTQITARDVANATYPPSSNGLIILPATTFVYSADKYFVTTVTNPMGHTSTTTTDAKTGMPTVHQAIQGGPVTSMAYDSIGRLVTTTTDGTQPIEQRITNCGPEPSYFLGDCRIKHQVFQTGAPIKTNYVDRLGRVIATGVEGFDRKEVITKVDYNTRGAKIAEHEPQSTGAVPGAWNGTQAQVSPYGPQYSNIDALGQVGTKTVVRSSAPDFFEPGKGSANLVTTYAYAAVPLGIQTSIKVFTPTTPSGQITMSRTYDPRGKLVQTVQNVGTAPTPIATTYAYDPAGSLTKITDTNNHDLTAAYDDLGRKTQVVDPDRGVWSYTWDGLGRVRTQVDARGYLLAYQYDAIGRLERRFVRRPGDTQYLLEANWQYDLNGKPGTLGAMLGAADPTNGTISPLPAENFHRDYRYDSLSRPFNVKTHAPANSSPAWNALDMTVEYGFDRNYGRVKAISYPSGELVKVDYDELGNSIGERLLGADGTPSTAYYRHVNSLSVRGQIEVQSFGNGLAETAEYDPATGMPIWMSAAGLHETSATCPTASAPLLRQLTYTYDHFLNLARQSKNLYKRGTSTPSPILFDAICNPLLGSMSEVYQYDELQRLTNADRFWTNLTPTPPTATFYSFDVLGNITSKTDYADTYTYAGPRPHAVTSVSNGGVLMTSFSYDANGNMTSSVGVDARGVTFDAFDRPVQIDKTGAGSTYFRYAPDGSRYAQRTTIGAGRYPKIVYYADKLYERVVWSNAADTEEKTYVGPSVVIYKQGSTRDVRYLHLDRLSSVEAVTTAGGAEFLPDSHSFDAFGKPRGREWQTTNVLHPDTTDYDFNKTTEHGFTGHEHLDETALIHMNGRVYDYKLGRFLSIDPIISNPANSQSINPYSYIGNNPLSGVDPTGYTEVVGGPSSGCAMFSRCDVTWVNTPITVTIVDNGGNVVSRRWYDPTTPTSQVFGPSATAAQSTNNSGADANAKPDRLKGALAFARTPEQLAQLLAKPETKAGLLLCAAEPWCAGPVALFGIGLGGWYVYTQYIKPTTATDATGALKPGEETPLKPGEQMPAPTPSLQPQADSGGAMSRGPGNPVVTQPPADEIASKIAAGHAFAKHGEQYTEVGVKNREDFAKLIAGIIRSAKPGDVRTLTNDRTAYWDRVSGTVIIHDRHSADGGTAFRPDNGRAYFDALK